MFCLHSVPLFRAGRQIASIIELTAVCLWRFVDWSVGTIPIGIDFAFSRIVSIFV